MCRSVARATRGSRARSRTSPPRVRAPSSWSGSRPSTSRASTPMRPTGSGSPPEPSARSATRDSADVSFREGVGAAAPTPSRVATTVAVTNSDVLGELVQGGEAMKRLPRIVGQIALVVLGVTWVAPAVAGTLRCPPDSAKVGDACIDLYEESVWQIPPSNTTLVRRVQSGRATLADLATGGATQLSPATRCNAGFPVKLH